MPLSIYLELKKGKHCQKLHCRNGVVEHLGHSNNFEDIFLTIFFAYVSEVSVGVLSSMNGIIGKMRSHETL